MNSFVEAGQLLSERYRLTSLFPEQLPYSGISVWSAIDTLLGTSLRLIILDPGAPNTTEALDSARRSSLIDDPHVVRILSVGLSLRSRRTRCPARSPRRSTRPALAASATSN